MRRIIAGLFGLTALVILTYFIFLSGRVILTDYITQVAVGLTLMIFGLGYWTFKPQISRWLNPDNEYNVVSKIADTNPEETPLIGKPTRIDENKIWHYESREQVKFIEFMRLAKNQIRMSALTFTMLTLKHERLLCQLAADRIRITFLILEPSSEQAKKETSLYESSDDLVDQINSSLKRLCKLKKQYPKYIFIKTYSQLHGNSIIILDDTVMKVEKHVIESGPDSRPNEIIFNKDTKREFLDYRKKYDVLEKTAAEYSC